MKNIVLSDKTVAEVKEEFTNIYPFLKIEFYYKAISLPEGATTVEKVLPVTGPVAYTGNHAEIKPSDTVKEVETKFNNCFGLPAQIFRKQNGVWLETTITDDLTLQEQNTWGREASKPLKIKVQGRYQWR